MILKLFPEESIVPFSASEPGGCHLASSVWQDRCAVLKIFKDIMQQWVVPLLQKALGFLGPSEDEASLTVEKSLAAHYTQAFFDCFGRHRSYLIFSHLINNFYFLERKTL